jgi:enoyl-[acyl-carrier protein] reductase II
MNKNRITRLFGIRYPIIQGGMIWNSGWRLAAAVSNAGGLGLIGAGSMYPEVFREHIRKCRAATQKPFGVNLPLIYPQIQDLIDIVLEEKVPIVFTSAGHPKKYTPLLKSKNIIVAHVVANLKGALKCVQNDVDAVVAEGFEAGGHNGLEETTTMVLIPLLRKHLDVPLIAAGGIGNGNAMLAAMALGADGVQVGSRFAASVESSSHVAYKKAITDASDGDTSIILKKVIPVRLIKNKFYQTISEMESHGATAEELKALLGRARAKKGMFEGDREEGELEVGQVSAYIDQILSVDDIMEQMISSYNQALQQLEKMPKWES